MLAAATVLSMSRLTLESASKQIMHPNGCYKLVPAIKRSKAFRSGTISGNGRITC
jgi:hypothetical protein